MTRRNQLRDAWQRVTTDVAEQCVRHGRDPADVTVIAVTKGHCVEDIGLLAELGVTDVGESRDSEARDKREHMSDVALRWHCIGQVQTNKAAKVVTWADVVHSVDRPNLASALARAVPPGRTLEVLLQVNTEEADAGDPQPGRGGIGPASLPDLVRQVEALPQLSIAGLMTVAPTAGAPGPGFRLVAGLLAELRTTHPQARMLSAGMSGDYAEAIAAGATHLRIGTAILGSR